MVIMTWFVAEGLSQAVPAPTKSIKKKKCISLSSLGLLYLLYCTSQITSPSLGCYRSCRRPRSSILFLIGFMFPLQPGSDCPPTLPHRGGIFIYCFYIQSLTESSHWLHTCMTVIDSIILTSPVLTALDHFLRGCLWIRQLLPPWGMHLF